MALHLWRWSCPLVAGGRAALAILPMIAKMDKIPSFWSLSCLAFVGLLANMALFRVFRGFKALSFVVCGIVRLGCFALIVGRFMCVSG